MPIAAGKLPTTPANPHRASASNHSCGDRAVLVTDGLQVWQESEGCIICRAASAVTVRIIGTAEPEAAAAALSSLADRVTDDASAGDPEILLLLRSVPPGRHRCMTLALDAAQELVASLTGG